MTCEVISTELIFRIEALGKKILSPFRNQRPVTPSERSIVFGVSKGGNHENHVARLFHWHLVILSHLAAAVELPVGQRIDAEIVRREGEFPIRALSITHDR